MHRNRCLFSQVALSLGLFLTVGLAYGQQNPNAVTPLNLLTCKTFMGGGQVTISTHGNIIQYESPLGFEHVGVGTFGEGYVLCNGGAPRFDLGFTESGFGPSTCSCPTANTCAVTRNTSDGLMRLRQDFTYLAGSGEKSLNIKMTVTNLTGSPLFGLVLRRQVDFDIDSIFSNNHAATTQDGVFAWNDANTTTPDSSHGLLLRHLNPNVRHSAKVTSNIVDSSCNPGDVANSNPVVGDFGDTLQYDLGTLNAGASKNVTVQYVRY